MGEFLGGLILGMPIESVPVVALDVETTGFDPMGGDRIVEIALIRSLRQGTTEAVFSSLVNPGRKIGARVTEVHGITNDHVADAPVFDTLAARWLHPMMSGGVLVGHNIQFDLKFLAHELDLCGIPMPECHVVCTLSLARQWLGLPKNKLGDVADYFGIEYGIGHRAADDARTTLEVFRSLCDYRGVTTWAEVLS